MRRTASGIKVPAKKSQRARTNSVNHAAESDASCVRSQCCDADSRRFVQDVGNREAFV